VFDSNYFKNVLRKAINPYFDEQITIVGFSGITPADLATRF